MSEQAPATTINGERRTIEHFHFVLPFQILEKIVSKPLRIKGVAITAGMSRNFNIYTPEELKAFTDKLASAPVYIEHVSVQDAVDKVTKTDWDDQSLWYEAEIYDDEVADKNSNDIVKSLMKQELEHLSDLGLTLQKQAEVGPPFMGIAMKETSYSDTIALKVTYSPPTSGGFGNIGEGMTNQTILS